MKFLLTAEAFPEDKYYMEHYLCQELVRLGHKTYVLHFGDVPRPTLGVSDTGINRIAVPPFITRSGLGSPYPQSLRWIADTTKRIDPDVTFCQPLFSPLSVLAIASQTSRHRTVVGGILTGGPLATTQGVYSRDSLSSFFRYMVPRVVLGLYVERRTEAVFALSKGLAGIIERYFGVPSSKIRLMPLGADPQVFKRSEEARQRVRKNLGFKPEHVVLVYTGRIIPSKEIEILLGAVNSIARSHANLRLLVVTNDDGRLAHLMKGLSIGAITVTHPLVPQDELPSIFSASDIAVWPGGPSISIAEAASTGLPIVIKKSPFTSYLLSNRNGLAFDGGSVADLAGKLSLLIEDPAMRREMAARSANLVVTRLNWNSITRRFVDVCQELVAAKASSNAV